MYNSISNSGTLCYNERKPIGVSAVKALAYIERGKFDTTPLITHRFKLEDVEDAYRIFENKLDRVIKVAITLE